MQLCLVVNLIFCLCSRYIWKRLSILVPAKFIVFVKFLLLICLILAQLSFAFLAGMMVRTDPLLLSYITAFSAGSVAILAFSMVVIDICSFLYRRILCRNEVSGSGDIDRTEIKVRMLLSLIAALFLIVVGNIGVSSLRVEYVTVPMSGLHPLYNGTTIVQVSDIHLGPFNGRSTLNSVVEQVNRVKGDVVVITGDLVDSSVEALREAVVPLKRLRTKYGVYYVTGV